VEILYFPANINFSLRDVWIVRPGAAASYLSTVCCSEMPPLLTSEINVKRGAFDSRCTVDK
jgi:hypothetical protein